jgi:hypothetical protein
MLDRLAVYVWVLVYYVYISCFYFIFLFYELCGIEHPIIQGGMHYVGYAEVIKQEMLQVIFAKLNLDYLLLVLLGLGWA